MGEHREIHLRELKEKDWYAVHEYAKIPDVSKYQAWGPNTEINSMHFLDQALEDAKKNPRERFAFGIIESDTNRLIGCAEFNIRDTTNRTGEIGYVLHPDVWGRGIATAAAKNLLEKGFTELNMHRIYATCDPGNGASKRVLQKIGMSFEGIMREDLYLKTRWRDSMLWSILESDCWVRSQSILPQI